nr:von Willebrand factor type A domain protein [Candidatus Prometheoarchaeum syntrophicum]
MEENLENWIILLDCTKSMNREDFPPNRFQTALSGIKIFIEEKSKALKKVRISIITFNKKISVVSELTDDVDSTIELISNKKFKKMNLSSGSINMLDNALNEALEILGQQIQNISGFYNCILLISDTEDLNISEKTQKKIKGLQISINIITFSLEKNNANMYFPLKAQHFTTKQDLLNGMKELALLKKKEKNNAQHFSEIMLEHGKKTRDFMEEIALKLRYPTLDELIKFNKKSRKINCQICFSKISPIKKYSLYKTGRLCPHCGTPMHLHCAGTWALKSSEHKGLFRCPYCYTLLKIPGAILNGLNKKSNKKEGSESKKQLVKMIVIGPEKLKQKYSDCLYCFKPIKNVSFQKTFQCSNCKAYFHKKCLEEMYKLDKKCLNCNGNIV